MDFREADRRYAEIKRRQKTGGLTQEEFDEQLKQLMVQDEEGRWWVKARTTGEWHYHDGSAWVKGTPPGYQAAQASPDDQLDHETQPERPGPSGPQVQDEPSPPSQPESGGQPSPVRTPPPAGTPTRDQKGGEPRRRSLVWPMTAAATVLVAIIGVIVAIGQVGGGDGSGSSGESGSSANKTLVLGNSGYFEDVAVSNLTKVVLEEDLDYKKVQLKGPLDVGPLYQGVASGDLQAFQDVWLPNHNAYLNKPQIKPNVEVLDPWYEGKTKYGITVLSYMKGITSIADLNHAGTNEITGIEPGAAFMPVIEDKVIPAYNLDMKLVTSSTAGMLAELERKAKAKEPIVFTGWSPHWMNLKYDIVYLDDPKNAQGPFDDASRITTVVNKDLAKEDPVAYAFLSELTLTEDQVNEIELEMNEAGLANEEEGVRNWLKDNRDVVQPAIDAAQKAQEG